MNEDQPRLHLVGSDADASGAAATDGPGAAKILEHGALLAARGRARRDGKVVVQCHGCFDIVHPGHLRHLRHAKAQGDILLVTITGDSMIAKGTGRPLIPQELRAENLAALDCVDWVYVESRPTAAQLLEETRPDVYVKGQEYELNNDPRFAAEKATVQRHGGRVVFSSGDIVFSSTALIAALEKSIDPYHGRLCSLLETPGLDGEELARTIGRFRGKKVVVAGEIIQDTYVLCDRPEVAGESPIMTLRPVEKRTYDGGAAIIARHLASMGALPVLVTALDDGEASRDVRQRLQAEGVDVRSVQVDRALPEKQRFLVGGQKVMKLDLVERLDPDAGKQDEFVELLTDALTEGGGGGVDAAVIADFGLGLFTQATTRRACAAARTHSGVVAGDVSGRRSNLLYMRDMDILCPSESEAREALRLFDQSLPAVAHNLLEFTASRGAIVTMGAEGLVAFGRLPGFDRQDAEWTSKVSGEHVPALCGHAIDPLGCGDALIAAATLTLTTGAGLLAASFLGATAAAVQVQRLGNTVVSATDLRHGVARLHTAHLAYAPSEVIQSRTPTRGRSGGRAAEQQPGPVPPFPPKPHPMGSRAS